MAQVRTYTEMLVEANQARWIIYNLAAVASTWFLLAAFLIIPGTFTSFRDSSVFQNANQADTGALVEDVLHSVAHIGLLWVAGTVYIVGLAGCFLLWRVWRCNYTWLLDRVFL